MLKFDTANEAFHKLYDMIIKDGVDFAGNIADKVVIKNITFDITNPVISIDNLFKSIYINSNTLSYTLSEPLATSTLTITRTAGADDNNSPQNISLTASELAKGSYKDVILNNNPILNNGTIYSFELSGQDYATNDAKSIVVENVSFDNQPPELSISRPIDAEQIKSTILSFSASENLETATAIFTQTSGTVDVNSPHKVILTGKELTKGVHSDFDLGITSQLADGGRYSVIIEAFDKAGNPATVQAINDVFFDLLPPVIAIESPSSGSRFNVPIATYSSNEEMGKASITYTRTAGAQDPQSPHIINLTGARLQQGTRYDETFENEITLKDGTVYSISMVAEDMAGNVAEKITVDNITFDSTGPEITILSPSSSIFTNQLYVDFSLNEQLQKAKIVLERTGGPNDSSSPHEINLVDTEISI